MLVQAPCPLNEIAQISWWIQKNSPGRGFSLASDLTDHLLSFKEANLEKVWQMSGSSCLNFCDRLMHLSTSRTAALCISVFPGRLTSKHFQRSAFRTPPPNATTSNASCIVLGCGKFTFKSSTSLFTSATMTKSTTGKKTDISPFHGFMLQRAFSWINIGQFLDTAFTTCHFAFASNITSSGKAKALPLLKPAICCGTRCLFFLTNVVDRNFLKPSPSWGTWSATKFPSFAQAIVFWARRSTFESGRAASNFSTPCLLVAITPLSDPDTGFTLFWPRSTRARYKANRRPKLASQSLAQARVHPVIPR